MNPFEDYAKKAQTVVNAPAKLLGPLKLRSDARKRYSEIVDDMAACPCSEDLGVYLLGIEAELLQFQAELEFYWEGDGDFLGLRKEIERARVRVDDGLDYPRYEQAEQGPRI